MFRPSTPTFDYLSWQIMHNLKVYIQSLTTASGIDSLAQWLEHWIFIRTDRVRIPRQEGIVFQLCFIPLLRLTCRKMGTRPRFDFILPKMALCHHK